MNQPEGKALTLFDINQAIKSTLLDAFPQTLWVIAEISDLKVNKSGHCYLELIQKDKELDEIQAKARATIWNNVFRMIKPYFETTTGETLRTGIKILINVTIEYHEIYGLSLNIHDIEPEYTIGDLAKQRQETIDRLKAEGVFTMNKELTLSLVPQRIAIISSDTAAGYKDFINQLINNPYNYIFYYKLFPSIMQGEEAENSIIASLEKIYQYEETFEVIVIIRGGGSKSDLNCFDNYWLAYNIAQVPIPVITGIGHEQDESVVDLIAHTNLKTPTAVAEFLINKAAVFESNLFEVKNKIVTRVNENLELQKYTLEHYLKVLPSFISSHFIKQKSRYSLLKESVITSTKTIITKNIQYLKNYNTKLLSNTQTNLHTKKHYIFYTKEKTQKFLKNYFMRKDLQLELIQKTNQFNDPHKILERGYSITYHNNAVLKKITGIKTGDTIYTLLKEGSVESKITS